MSHDEIPSFGSGLLDLETRLFGRPVEIMVMNLSYDERLGTLWKQLQISYLEPDASLDSLCRQCGMTKNNLNYLLKRLSGMTCMRLIRAYRVYRCICEGLERNCSFTELAYKHGFSSSSSFSRAVRELLDVSPRKLLPRGQTYRRELRLPGTSEPAQSAGQIYVSGSSGRIDSRSSGRLD